MGYCLSKGTARIGGAQSDFKIGPQLAGGQTQFKWAPSGTAFISRASQHELTYAVSARKAAP
jgi:hypothetical protein